jgi:hypothetical protein
MSLLSAALLEQSISGFKVGERALLAVRYAKQDKLGYHQYEGGSFWTATAPAGIGRDCGDFDISVTLLTKSEFLNNLPRIELKNKVNFSWLPKLSMISFNDSKSKFSVQVEQYPEVEGISGFELPVELDGEIGFVPGNGCYVKAKVQDCFG